MNAIHVTSEIKPLKKVLLHRPGRELLNIIPDKLTDLLFDDIPYLRIAQKEHDAFAEILRQNGAEVVYLEDLMAQTLDQHPELRAIFLKEFLQEAGIHSTYYTRLISDYLNANYRDNLALVNKLIEGMRLNELPKDQVNTLADYLDSYEETMLLNPLPNLYFQRDPFASIGEGVSIHHMHTATRHRESIFAHYIFTYHKDYKGVDRYYDRNESGTLEGGDIFNLNEKTLAIGISERTNTDAIEQLARRCFRDPNCAVEEIDAFVIPKSRAFMHLDTVFTQIDYDKFTVHPKIVAPMRVLRLTPSGDGIVHIEEVQAPLEEVLARILKLDHVELLSCGGGDLIAASREQWNDGSNTLCLAPGTVVTYERNEATNAYLRQHGIQVIEMPSCELSRGRGGPRCMTMPLIRED